MLMFCCLSLQVGIALDAQDSWLSTVLYFQSTQRISYSSTVTDVMYCRTSVYSQIALQQITEVKGWLPNLMLLNADVESCCLSQFHSPSLPGKRLGKLFMETFTMANSCIFFILLLTNLRVSLTSRSTEHLCIQPKLMGAVLKQYSTVLYNTGY